jgi:transcriptional regulator with XRE-family HTH domain
MRDRRELGGFLRTRRERITPSEVGIAATLRRRTSGLRREEVATLAGVSVDYYTRLEQARGPRPSASVLAALARALRLTDDERDHLYHVAGQPPPPRDAISQHVRPGVLHLLDRLADSAAMVVSDTGEVLAWTPLAAALFVDFGGLPRSERNLFRRFFGGSPESSRIPDDDRAAAARVHVADLRATVGRRPDDPDLLALVAELQSTSPLFARLWNEHDVAVRRAERKRIEHPSVGLLELDCEVLITATHDQRLILHTAAPGTPTADRLDLLRVLGTQDLPDPAPLARQVAPGKAHTSPRTAQALAVSEIEPSAL